MEQKTWIFKCFVLTIEFFIVLHNFAGFLMPQQKIGTWKLENKLQTVTALNAYALLYNNELLIDCKWTEGWSTFYILAILGITTHQKEKKWGKSMVYQPKLPKSDHNKASSV